MKVCDFGLAGKTEGIEQSIKSTQQILGSINYMSPEQRLGKKTDEKTDTYSLAAVLYEGITGEPPIGKIKTVKPKALAELIEENLDSNPEKRDTAKQIAERLEKLRQDPQCLKTGLTQASKITQEKTSKIQSYDKTQKQELEKNIEELTPLLKGLEQALYAFKGDATEIKEELEKLKAGQRELYEAATEGNIGINLPGGILTYTLPKKSIVTKILEWDVFGIFRTGNTHAKLKKISDDSEKDITALPREDIKSDCDIKKEVEEQKRTSPDKSKWSKCKNAVIFLGCLTSATILTNSALNLKDRIYHSVGSTAATVAAPVDSSAGSTAAAPVDGTFLGARGVSVQYLDDGEWTSEKPEKLKKDSQARLAFSSAATGGRDAFIKMPATLVPRVEGFLARSERQDAARGNLPEGSTVNYLNAPRAFYTITEAVAAIEGNPKLLEERELNTAEGPGRKWQRGFFGQTSYNPADLGPSVTHAYEGRIVDHRGRQIWVRESDFGSSSQPSYIANMDVNDGRIEAWRVVLPHTGQTIEFEGANPRDIKARFDRRLTATRGFSRETAPEQALTIAGYDGNAETITLADVNHR